jgi:hypothetical protein
MFPNPVPTRRSDHELVPHTNKAAPLRCMPQASAAWPDQKRRPAWTNQSGSARAKINANWILSVRACSWDSRWAAVFPVVSYRFSATAEKHIAAPILTTSQACKAGFRHPGSRHPHSELYRHVAPNGTLRKDSSRVVEGGKNRKPQGKKP